MSTATDIALETEALARAEKLALEAGEKEIALPQESGGEAQFIPQSIDPQWMIAYKMFVDEEGEYGIPYPVPIGQFTQGANALVNMRRIDGGRAWTAVKPKRVAPEGSIECISERCGDAHLGGRRKKLKSLDALIKHVAAFHPDEYETYSKYFDQIKDDLALQNPRLQRIMAMRESVQQPQANDAPAIFYCDDDECTRFFDTPQGLSLHRASAHRKGGSDGDHDEAA